jgi:hypothetical protein
VQKLREEKIEESKDDDSEDNDEESSSHQLFREIKLKEDEIDNKNCCEKSCDFIFKYFSMFDNIKFLSQKKNIFFDGFNLEIITYLRIITMILMTFINNFEALIKIPSRYFFYESFYIQFSTVYLKFASFSVDIWLCLDGFETMYKLISYYKKYKLNKEGKKKNRITLQEFSAMQSGVLNTCKLAEAGMDIPGLSVGIMLGVNSSETKAQQTRGRIIRKEGNKEAEYFTLVINDTIESKWWQNSHKNDTNIIKIDSENLIKVLNGEPYETYTKKLKNYTYRF